MAKAKTTLQEAWAAVAGMSDQLNLLDEYEQWLQEREVEAGSADEAEKSRRMAIAAHARIGLATMDPVLGGTNFVANFQATLNSARAALQNYNFQPGQGDDAFTDFVRTQLVSVATPKELIADIVEVTSEASTTAKQLAFSLQTSTDLVQTLTSLHEELSGKEAELFAQATNDLHAAVAKLDEDNKLASTKQLKELSDDREAAAKAFEEAHVDAERVLSELREKLAFATDAVLSDGYTTAAESEKTQADSMRTMAIWFGIAAAVIGVAGVLVQFIWPDHKVSAANLLPGKIGAVAAFGALAGWLGRESGRHRIESMRLRRVALQLQNLGSFLAELDPPDRNAARNRLVDRFFSDDPAHPKLDGPGTGTLLGDAISGGG